MSKHYAIIGAGVAGLAAAYRLVARGDKVTIIERSAFVGGQLATTLVGDVSVEHYYHHVFTSDEDLLGLCEELGISGRMCWLPSTMGYFSDQLYPFGTPKSILGFKPLGWFGKVAFVLSTGWITFLMTSAYAEKYTVKAWFLKYGFSSVWDVVWKPLFRLKFAADADHISLVWLWGKLHTRGTSRRGRKEVLGYMQGSFGHLALALKAAIESRGGVFLLNTAVHEIVVRSSEENRGESNFMIQHASGGLCVDGVISTQSSDQLLRSVTWSPKTVSYLSSLTYKSAICVMVIGDRAWFDRYWINIGDATLPFGGIVEHTNWVSPEVYGGKHVMYLSRYLDDEDSLLQMSDAEIITLFCNGLKVLLPDFSVQTVSDIRVFRQRNAQPVVPMGYIPPSMETEVPGLYWISTHHTYPFDRGINYAIRLANRLVASLVP